MPLTSVSRLQKEGPLESNRSDNSDTMRSDDFKLTGAARRMQVLLETNSLLEKMGFGTRSFEDYDDLVASVSSMSVALYEKLFQFHLEHVVRVPEHAQDYIHNAQLVVDALSGALLDESFDTEHVTGASLCDGDVASIQQLVRMFVQIYEILYAEQQPPLHEEENDRNEYDQAEEEMELQGEYERQHGDDDCEDEEVHLPTQHKPAATVQKKKRSDLGEKKQKSSASRQSARAATHSRNSHSHSSTSSTGNGNGTNSKKLEPRATGSAANIRDARSTRTPLAKPSLHAGSSSPTTMKKRTRHVKETHAMVNRKEMIHTSNATIEKELLTTQRYGRFVPVPQRPVRRGNNRHGREDPADDNSGEDEGDAADDDDGLELLEEELAAGETYFGGVSSVSGASGSSASIHFMEEEGDFAKNFSNIQSHSSPGTDSKDSPETGTDSMPDHQNPKPPLRQNKNQQNAETEQDASSPSTSPLKKKVAKAQQPTMSPTGNTCKKSTTTGTGTAPARAGANAVKRDAPFSVLYPLTPETTRHDRTSNAYKEHLRYKIQLKDHLQELRHREFCQRQHLERAYRLGEHTATVERIRARRFEQELRLHRIAVNLDAKTQEEKQLRDAMQHMLHLEKEKLRDEHKTTKHVLRTIQKEHAEREQAMEAFYATQIQLVKEQTRRELSEREAVERAHRMASEQMIREMKRDRERQLSELLTEKQHLAQVRRFRHATQLTHAVDRGTEISQRQGDAFYAAAMKARQLRAMPTSSSCSSSSNTTRAKTKTKTTGTTQSRLRATASIYSTPRATNTGRRRTVVRV